MYYNVYVFLFLSFERGVFIGFFFFLINLKFAFLFWWWGFLRKLIWARCSVSSLVNLKSIDHLTWPFKSLRLYSLFMVFLFVFLTREGFVRFVSSSIAQMWKPLLWIDCLVHIRIFFKKKKISFRVHDCQRIEVITFFFYSP